MKIKFSWTASTYYEVGAVVVANDKFWKCLTAHTSASSFTVAEQSNWVELSKATMDDWVVGKNYTVGQFVLHLGAIYRCTVSHISTDFVSDISNWELVVGAVATKAQIDALFI